MADGCLSAGFGFLQGIEYSKHRQLGGGRRCLDEDAEIYFLPLAFFFFLSPSPPLISPPCLDVIFSSTFPFHLVLILQRYPLFFPALVIINKMHWHTIEYIKLDNQKDIKPYLPHFICIHI